MFYSVKTWHTTVNCGNQGAINMSEGNLRRITPGSNCTDIPWNLQNTRNKMSATIKNQHVDGHMDKYLLWQQILLEHKMNVICNTLAKQAVSRAIRTGMRREGKQLLSSEGVCQQ